MLHDGTMCDLLRAFTALKLKAHESPMFPLAGAPRWSHVRPALVGSRGRSGRLGAVAPRRRCVGPGVWVGGVWSLPVQVCECRCVVALRCRCLSVEVWSLPAGGRRY